ncbi:MAG: electron transfer flavoprotein subunit beta/FixA family protein [Lachnospiraceae bacterium]|nr:electron transfer flavoprotein subunit beta/FixA family protein [Lachnospiraceae bacterium]
MNILVCVKQVPDTTIIKIDPVTNTLIRSGVPSILNPFDGYAMEAAARIKDKAPDTKIVIVSMGPNQAEEVIRECLAMGADKGYLVTDRAFGGSDTLATSYILSCAVKKMEELEGKFDMIFCGKQAIDGDTAQVGCELAEHLNLPQVTFALEAEAAPGRLEVIREFDDGKQVIGIQYPCVITFTKPSFDPRFPTIKSKMKARKAEIPHLTVDEFPGINRTAIGLKGSPTRVKTTFVPEQKKGGVILQEESNEESALKLVSLLSEAKII